MGNEEMFPGARPPVEYFAFCGFVELAKLMRKAPE